MIMKILALATATLFLGACQKASPVNPELDPESLHALGLLSASERATLAADNGFGFNLLAKLAAEDTAGNLFLSPLSVSLALTMTSNGARGETGTAMAKALGHEGMDATGINALYTRLIPALASVDPRVRLDIANSIWSLTGFPVASDFLDLNRRTFGAETRELDFAAAGAAGVINKWVEGKTQGKIKDLVADPIGSDVRMILINALYFKGDWSNAFPDKGTRDGDFTAAGGAVKRCAFMHSDVTYRHYSSDPAQVVELPYGDSLFAMDLILPKAADGMDAVIAALQGGAWDDWSAHLTGAARVSLPKLKVDYGLSLNHALEAMGMGVAFTFQADFSGISKNEGLAISKVVHKTYLEVDEKGTTAAAATEVEMIAKAAMPEPVIEFNRPFLLLIREKTTGTVLFLGRMQDPSL